MSDITNKTEIKSKEAILKQIEEVLNVEFSKEQREAIYHFGKPLNILSCAGSGKTTTLIGKMLFMEMYYGVYAKKMLAITFNREAIDELEGRYNKARKKLGLSKKEKVTFKTYHALYNLILASKHTDHSWNDIKEYTSYAFKLDKEIKKVFRNYDDDTLREIMNIRSFKINNLLNEEELLRTPKFLTTGIDPENYKAIIDKYEELKKESKNIDFDDLQVLMYEEIIKNENLLEVIYKAWDYILVDEYQDISKIQLEILKKMVKDPNKLTVIGDDDQSIYEFRGSKTDYIVDFGIHFIGADRIVMDTNYRCPENILMPITNSINNNKKRVKKKMKAHKSGGNLKYTMTKGMYSSAISIADEIDNYYKEGKNLDEIVILIRNNKQQRLVLDALLERDIPVSTVSDYRITNHFILNDIKEIVELALDDKNADSFKKVFTKVAKFVKRKLIDDVAEKMKIEEKSWRDYLLTHDNPSIHETSSMLFTVEASIKGETSFKKIVETIQPFYREYLKFMVARYDYDANEIGDVLNYIKEIGESKTFEQFYKDCKRKDSLKRFFADQPDNTVKISTMHRMKGLEYSSVYLLDLTDSILPNEKIETEIREKFGDKWADDYIEQERRLFYVAWTRAKEYLNVFVNQDNCSRFIIETIQGGNQPKE